VESKGGIRRDAINHLSSTRFELVVNRKAVKALGLTLPPTIMIRACDYVLWNPRGQPRGSRVAQQQKPVESAYSPSTPIAYAVSP
jgi:hypothetical protein